MKNKSTDSDIDIRCNEITHIFLPRSNFKGFSTRLDNGRYYVNIFGLGELEYNDKGKFKAIISILKSL